VYWPIVLTLFDYESLVWNQKHRVERTMYTTLAIFCIDPRPDSRTSIGQVISCSAIRAFMRGLGWHPM